MKEKEAGLSRGRLVSEALGLVQEEGLDALSMRRLADRLNVKAASLYWHVRDRRELLDLLAESILGRVAASPAGVWRPALLATAAALRAVVASQRDANRILLEVPDALTGCVTHATIKGQLEGAGLLPAEAWEVALMVMVHVITEYARHNGHADLLRELTDGVTGD